MPPTKDETFPELASSLIHWYGPIEKLNAEREVQQRMLFVTQQSLYICLPQGGITRCIQLDTLNEIHVTGPATLELKAPPPYHDFTFSVSSDTVKDTIIHILHRLHFALKGYEIPIKNFSMTDMPLPEANNRHVTSGSGLEAVTPWSSVASCSPSRPLDVVNVRAGQQNSLHDKENLRAASFQEWETYQYQDCLSMLEATQRELTSKSRLVVELNDEVKSLLKERDEFLSTQKSRDSTGDMVNDVKSLLQSIQSKDAQIEELRKQLERLHTEVGPLRECSTQLRQIKEYAALLEKENEAQRDIIYTLQTQCTNSGAKESAAAEVSALRHDLEEARVRLRSLQASSIDQASATGMETTLKQMSVELNQVRALLHSKEAELHEKDSALALAETECRTLTEAHTRELTQIRTVF